MPLRLAFVTPLPPLASGIADYSAALLPHLARHFDLEVFAEPGSRLEVPGADAIAVHPLDLLPGRHQSHPFGAVLYQLGNNGGFHAGSYRQLFRIPGLVMLHELVLHHMVRELTLVAGDRDAYLAEMHYCGGRSGHLLARRSLDNGTPFDVWGYPLFERVVDSSLGVLVHGDESRRRILASRPRAAVEVVPHPWFPQPPDPPAGSAEASREGAADATSAVRDHLGLPPAAFLICTFGYMTRAKRLDVVLRAFARLAARHPEALFVVVGEVSKEYDLASLLPPELATRVVLTGRPDLPTFLAYMQAADVAVNLRHPSAGEASGTLLRLLGLGKPVIVTAGGSFAELPDGSVVRVEPDGSEEDLLLAYLEALRADPDLRRRLGENARRHAETVRVDRAATRHAEAIHQLLAARVRPLRELPPLLPYPPEDVLSEVVADLTAAAVDLGTSEGDDDLLASLAGDLLGLGLEVGE